MSGYSAALTRLEPAMIPLLVLLVIPACMFVSKEDLPGRPDTVETGPSDSDSDPITPQTWYADADGDGYGDLNQSQQAEAMPEGYVADDTDCDDTNPEVYPGADEICDEVDQDCDQEIDEDPVDGQIWYADVDGDGYGSGDVVAASCDAPEGASALNTDCDDADPTRYPGADELCDDDKINSCDGLDEAAWGLCGLTGELSLAASEARLLGEDTSDSAGYSVSGAHDVNGDGLSDLLIGALEANAGVGAAYLVLGPVRGDLNLADADVRLPGEVAPDLAGLAVATLDDIDGDGLDDLLVGAEQNGAGGENAGAAYVVYGPATDTEGLADANARLLGEYADFVGRAVSEIGDQDGDGLADMVVGTGYHDNFRGVTYIVTGPPSGDAKLVTDAISLVGEDELTLSGDAIASADDMNGDGVDDLIIGAPWESTASHLAGATYLALGPIEESQSLADAHAKLVGVEGGGYAGLSVAGVGDADGDGTSDLMIGVSGPGVVYLIPGLPETESLSAFELKIVSDSTADSLYEASKVGDVNGDGFDDLLVGASNAESKGAAYLFFGPIGGSTPLSSADATLVGEAEGDVAAYALAGAGDVNGDGAPDLLIGAIGVDTNGDSAGAAYLILGGHY